MSHLNACKSDKETGVNTAHGNENDKLTICNWSDSCNYAVTVSKKPSKTNESGLHSLPICPAQKSFISIHSTDQLCQVADVKYPTNECNVEVLSLNELFPSTSEDSLSNEDATSGHIKNKLKSPVPTTQSDNASASSFVSTKPMTERQTESVEGQAAVFSDFNIPKNTLYVIGSNPGEPKMSYQDPPKKMSKTMKKFLRNIDKHKSDNKGGEKAVSKLTTMRGILKDGRSGPECTGDSSVGDPEENTHDESHFSMDTVSSTYSKQIPDKNVSFNTQVVIIHFTGDLCVGQSFETLSKENDQQARNSELRKTFLTKCYELWPQK